MKLIDISNPVFSCKTYPGDPKPERELLESLESGGECDLSAVYSCVHTGTHVDAPAHYIEGGDTVEKLSLECFIGPCTVLELPAGIITGDYVDRKFPKNVERLLIKGGGRAFFMDSAAQELAQRGITLIGTDALSVGSECNEIEPHRAFLQNGIAVLEGLDLSNVKGGNYFLIAPPVKYDGIEAAPTRAVLIDGYIFWSAK